MVTFAESLRLFLWLKSQNKRGASPNSAFIGNCLTISHTCWPYLRSRWVLLFISGVNQGNERGQWDQDFSVLLQGFGSFHTVFSQDRLHNLVRVKFLKMIKPMKMGFCSIWGWCYSGWWLWDLRTLAQFQGSETSPGSFQDFVGGI